MLQLFYTFMTALCAALVMVPFLRRWALEKGTVDQPDERKLHATPTPRLGGIAIFLAFLFSALIYAPPSLAFRGILAGGLVVFATGIADDLHGISSRNKFFGQIVACLATIVVGNLWLHDLGDLFGFGRVILPVWLGVPFTVFAVVGVSNAINLIDGLDGLAGGVSVLALTALAVLGLLDRDPLVPAMALALTGAVLGFLKYNFYPARIFMGDTGSLTVGFLLGFFAVHLTQRPGAGVSPMLPVLILGLPLFDAIWVMSRRLLLHMNPFAADNSHVHHKFLSLGFEHRFTVLLIYAISLFWSCSALLLSRWPEFLLLAYLLGTAVLCYLALRYLLRYRERYPLLQRDNSTGLRQSRFFSLGADWVDRIMPLLAVLLGLYTLLAAAASLHDGHTGWPVALVVFIGGMLIRQTQNDRGGEFMLLLVYAAAALAAFDVWRFDQAAIYGLSVKRLGDGLLLVVSVFVVLKLFFRRPGEFFLATADFLALTLVAFLAIASQQPTLKLAIGGPLFRAILLMLAVRTIASRGPASRRILINVSLLLLAVFALAGFR
jgi:UDP-GlcNAc:undecaprenyl-phosphate GlcNAc-1-phosphate transferase